MTGFSVTRLADRSWDWIAVGGIALGVLVRALWIFVLHPPLDFVYSDMEGYVSRAHRVAEGAPLHRYDAFYPPGTHVLFSIPAALLGTGRAGLWGGAALLFVLSSLTPFLVWRLTRVLLTPAAAAVAAILTAVWPLHISYAGYFLSETPSLAFLLASLWLGYVASRARARTSVSVALGLAAGVLGGAALATRPQFALNLAILAVPMLRHARRHTRALAGLAAGAALVTAATAVYASAAAGKLTGTSENGGVTFFIGHCDVRRVFTGPQNGFYIWVAAPPAVERGTGRDYTFPDHLAWEQGFYYEKGLECIRDAGLSHFARVGRNVLDMTATTRLWPQVDEPRLSDIVDGVNLAYCLALPLVAVFAIRLARRRRRRGEPSGELVLLAHLAVVIPLAIVVFGDPRFRTPYDVFGLALFAAVVADRFFDRRAR